MCAAGRATHLDVAHPDPASNHVAETLGVAVENGKNLGSKGGLPIDLVCILSRHQVTEQLFQLDAAFFDPTARPPGVEFKVADAQEARRYTGRDGALLLLHHVRVTAGALAHHGVDGRELGVVIDISSLEACVDARGR